MANDKTHSDPLDLRTQQNTLMRVGCDNHTIKTHDDSDDTSKANLEFKLRHGVRHITAKVQKYASGGFSNTSYPLPKNAK